MRNAVTLACVECKQRNYQTNKNKKNDPDRLEFNKYCKFCKKHTLHKETKQFLHKVMQGYSSIGRVAVSKTVGCGFKSYCPCQMFICKCSMLLWGCESLASQETAVQTSASRFKKFFREVKAEMKKVSWPNKQELISYTIIVFVTVLFVVALIWLYDAIFTKVLEYIIR